MIRVEIKAVHSRYYIRSKDLTDDYEFSSREEETFKKTVQKAENNIHIYIYVIFLNYQ